MRQPEDIQRLIEEDVIMCDPLFISYRGSITHGTYNEESLADVDLLSVYFAGLDHYLGFRKKKHDTGHDKDLEEFDVVNYELRHFMEMLKGCNPNVYNTLYMSRDFFVSYDESSIGRIRENKDLFYDTKLIIDSYKGYAHGQYNRLRKDPRNFDEIKTLEELDKKGYENLPEQEKELYDYLEDKYWSGWMGRKRKEKVLEYGYDPKWSRHCIRLLRNGMELLRKGSMFVDRTNIDKEELIEIKSGTYDFDEICDLIEDEFEQFETVADNADTVTSDQKEIENLLIEIVKEKGEI